ncbi:acyltransferase [Gordonia sp. (in: high G+C Gram-positive bacteria)]|uniref:acyltransferase n=1 Tax=Gordonia sp. (in: high G+C Gram-positive bacteria) TaxID=84139 RepID=UPI00333EF478
MSDTETGTPEKKPAKKDRHLYQIDFVRLVTFAGVILDHVILGMAPYTAIIAQGAGLILRYTRYCFFALTGFVLTYQYRNRDLHAPTFWRRRFKLIGLPFLVWSLFYWLNKHYQKGGLENVFAIFDDSHTIRLAVKSFAYDLITGHAAYHLYFLSVSMQIYVVFPLVLWVIKRTWGYHRYLLALSAAVQAWFMFQMVRDYPKSFLGLDVSSLFEDTPLGTLWRYLPITILPYQFFIFAGCLAAYHFEAFTGFMKKYRFYIVGAATATIIATLAYFKGKANGAVDMPDPAAGTEEMFRATNVFMFHNVFLFLSVICILFIGGMAWQARRRPGSLADTILRKGSDRSFAIYLGHVIVLSEVMSTTRRWDSLSMGMNILITYVITLILTVFLAEVLRRSPVSLVTTGREREDWRKQTPAKSAVVAIGAIVVGGALREWANTSIGSLIAAIGVLLLWSAAVVAARQLSETREERAADRAAALAEPEPSLVDEIEDPVTDIPVDDETPARVTDKKD